MNIKGSLFDGAWYVAFREADRPLMSDIEKHSRFTVIKNTIRYWCADPFLFIHEGNCYIFMELYDTFKQKGVIGYRSYANGKYSRLHVCLETSYHLSYPYIFEKDGNIYMLPESYQSGCLTLYRAECFPDKWVPCDTFIKDTAICDTDYIVSENGEYLLTTPVYGEPFIYDKLYLYKKYGDEWVYHKTNPVIHDASCARNAGKPFMYDGKLYRTAQNCSKAYGENLIFNEVKQMDENGYAEILSAKIYVNNIDTDDHRHNFSGIHTYNRCQHFEVVDLYCGSVFQPMRFLRLLLQKMKIRKA